MCACRKACAHTYSNCNRPHTCMHAHMLTFWEMPVICIWSSCVCVNTMGSVFSEGDIVQQREEKWEYCSNGNPSRWRLNSWQWHGEMIKKHRWYLYNARSAMCRHPFHRFRGRVLSTLQTVILSFYSMTACKDTEASNFSMRCSGIN